MLPAQGCGPVYGSRLKRRLLNRYAIVGVAGSVTMQSESVTKRSYCYDVWFAEERAWTARVTWPALAELYPGEKDPFHIFDY